MNLYRAIIVLCFLPLLLTSQDVGLSQIVIEQGDAWTIKVRSEKPALEQELEHSYGEDSYDTTIEFEALIVEHLLDNIEIKVNDNRIIELVNPKVESDEDISVVFNLVDMPEKLDHIFIENTSFQNVPDSRTGVFVLKKGYKRKQFTLSNFNQYRVILSSTGYSFELANEEVRSNFTQKIDFKWAILILLSVLLISFFWFKYLR